MRSSFTDEREFSGTLWIGSPCGRCARVKLAEIPQGWLSLSLSRIRVTDKNHCSACMHIK